MQRRFEGQVALVTGAAGGIGTPEEFARHLAMGYVAAQLGTRFIATREANAKPEYKQMLVESTSDDVVYTSLFTGVKGNYLRGSVLAAGLDPDQLPEADKSKMNFGSGGNMDKKAWRDIWGAGQGVGLMEDVPTVAEVVQRLRREYVAARERVMATPYPRT